MNQELVRALFTYQDGHLFWKVNLSPSIQAGKKVEYKTTNGYKRKILFRKSYGVHKLIWMYHFGDIPNDKVVDHIDGNPSNNHIKNLRLATISENKLNSKLSKLNTSGCVGVVYRPERGTWVAQISLNNKYKHLGTFTSFEEAKQARLAAEKEYGVFDWCSRSRKA